MSKRLLFAKEYLEKDQDWWIRIIFSDESKFNISESDGQITVWRRRNEEFSEQNLQATVKDEVGSVMVWGCMSARGVGNLVFIDGKMDKYSYLQRLKDNLQQSAEKKGIHDRFAFYQDNGPKNMSYIVQLWSLYHCPKVLHPPPQSPDMNVIEHLWDRLEKQVRKPIKSKLHLKERLQKEWRNVCKVYTRKLVQIKCPKTDLNLTSDTNKAQFMRQLGQKIMGSKPFQLNPRLSHVAFRTVSCETWTLTLREEQRLKVFENKVLRKIFGAKRDEVTGEWRKLHNAELRALYSSPDIIRNIKSRRLRWAGHVARMGESKNARYRKMVTEFKRERAGNEVLNIVLKKSVSVTSSGNINAVDHMISETRRIGLKRVSETLKFC
ncbi:hypothetical protein ANN_11220 [Periplaneta americana]|uniref:Tc1-like transposase DDE domain-containing protein n=1 Tax=Periplaneta americana TaxID=6978 RepID=A0ABQ8T646_PERAM|nr:hypothetical protein ANN_11220 [Periplaneta americana]